MEMVHIASAEISVLLPKERLWKITQRDVSSMSEIERMEQMKEGADGRTGMEEKFIANVVKKWKIYKLHNNVPSSKALFSHPL